MSEVAHALSDAAARERAVNSLESVLVQAPAGSGKTTLLTQRYLHLLGLVDSPERILALTFTRRAAQEMRQRVLAALSAAGEDECPARFNAETWRLARAAKRRMDELGCDVQLQPARLRIETIDAFNAWLANQLPIASGAGSGLRVLTDVRPCYEEAARRTLANDARDSFGIAVDRVLELDDQRWRKLVELISEMLPTRDRWLPLLAGRLGAASVLDDAQLQSVREHLDEDLALLVGRVLARAAELLGRGDMEALSALLPVAARRMEDPAQLAAWRTEQGPLRAEAADVPRWRAMAQLLLTSGRDVRRSVNKAQGFPPGCPEKNRMLEILQRFDSDTRIVDMLLELRTLPDSSYGDEAWGRVREVAQVLVLAAAELDGVFREQGAVDFPAVSMAALRALGSADAPTDLNLRLDYRLQHILVDEFQDTSSSQLELVRLLTSGWQPDDGRSIFCVGDPMQSIYGFRQAEVRAFLELAEEGIGAVRFDVQRLRSNFRSAAPLVAWSNRTFAQLLPQVDDRSRGAIAFRASAAAVESLPDAQCDVRCTGFATRSEESAAIASLIFGELQRHPEWRIAVLVRARAHAREIAASLREQGIAFRAVDIEPLDDRAVVRDVIMLSCALLHLGDRTAWLAVLRAPWAGLPLRDLLIVSRAPGLIWESVLDDALLDSLSEEGRAGCLRIRKVFQEAFRLRGETSLARWIERTWLGLGGPACVASPQDLELAAAAFARLRALDDQGMPDSADLAESFSDMFAAHGQGAVEIMTIHKAKGLEFDLVVLPALDRAVPPDRSQLLLSHQFARTRRDGMVMAARPPVGADNDLLFDFLRSQRRDAAVLEAQRLLYVACTRAKCQLRLTAMIGDGQMRQDLEESSATKEWRPRAGSLLRVLWPVAADEFEIAESPHDRDGPPSDGAPRGGPLRRLPRHWQPIFRDGALAAETLTPTRDETPIFDWAGETARRVGSLVHAQLQDLRLEGLTETSIRARQAQFRRWLEVHGVPGDRLQEASSRAVDALVAVHRDAKGRWILATGYRDDFREHALSGYIQGELIHAVFDRSFIDEAGIRWVIDYKTSQHLGGDLDAFLDREVDRYRQQLQRYGRLARRLGPEEVRLGLYFPLMRAWREWPFEE